MRQLFISDLHLSEHQPLLTSGFVRLLQHFQTEPTELYILGDWFETWLDDADPSGWLLPIVKALRDFTHQGNHIYFLVGNRDFLLGQRFLDRFDGKLLHEPYCYQWQGLNFRLEHGDSLCTDDVDYQRYKKTIRHPISLATLKALPFKAKKMLANHLRNKSKQNQARKAPIDVNAEAVAQALHECDILIHGHTHRPAIYALDEKKYRIVLGDWREQGKLGSAKILLLNDGQLSFELQDWDFS
ncbi:MULTISPECIES: UDP-2,3-diacylglucosamine diphosphatase [unclassified Acinetobacter]|uniref:UDP-2,3-diacylglucosamine diphosphatase n=1 Tax=unclassified Acinetobacter TaxID=196816 RepID=UPI0035BAEF30